METERSLEEVLAELDTVINSLQTDKLTLEETFAGYKKGLSLAEEAGKKIDKIECDIKMLDPDAEKDR